MNQIAIISDIHGNLEALKAVLQDIHSQGIETIYCLGDIIAKGTHMQACVDLVRKHCQVVILGNCDERFTSEIDLTTVSEVEKKRILWNRAKIDEDTARYLHDLPFAYEFYMSGRLVRLLHAQPTRNNIAVGNIDTLAHHYEMFLPSQYTSNQKADVVIYGHIHVPFVQKIYNRILINAGSVGNAIDIYRNEEKDGDEAFTTVANYIILKGDLDERIEKTRFTYEIVNVPYDYEKELSLNDDNIEYDSYQEEIRHGRYRDMAKIHRFLNENGIKDI
ncbi:MAG: metallophosphoesterase family protein [bacterium]